MSEELAVAVGKIAELHGRAFEINRRIQQNAQMLTVVQHELSAGWMLSRRVAKEPRGERGTGRAETTSATKAAAQEAALIPCEQVERCPGQHKTSIRLSSRKRPLSDLHHRPSPTRNKA